MMDNVARCSLVAFIVLLLAPSSRADFVYPDFNETTGLVMLGDTRTSNCADYAPNDYGDVHGDANYTGDAAAIERGEKTDLIFESVMDTNDERDNVQTEKELSGFLHRKDTRSAPSELCPTRVRLTPSGPSKVGGMWFREQVPVLSGFETTFEFQITDHSKECTLHKDQYFSQLSHRTCAVRGADGFAFVIHNDPRKLDAIGDIGLGPIAPGAATGGQLGFGGRNGISNSLAIVFDTWQNQGDDRVGEDHVKVISMGRDENGPRVNDALKFEADLGYPRTAKLADGVKHKAKIMYFPVVEPSFFDFLVASSSLEKYLLDNGEQKRVGTLVIFLDDGIDKNEPLMAMPINLSLLLELPDDKAYVGFTSSTGRFYEKHDILAWHFCDQNPCEKEKMDKFDYHQQSKSFSQHLSELRWEPQGYDINKDFGGDSIAKAFPLRHTSPDTTAVQMPIEHWSESRNMGLADGKEFQVPPATRY